MKHLILLLFSLVMFSSKPLLAQDYKTALGLRIGPYYGVTLKHFLQKEGRAIEGILMTRNEGFSITGLYEAHTTAFSVERLTAYGGIGGHVNFFEHKNNDDWDWDDEDDSIKAGDNTYMSMGIDMILGLEYTFSKLPFNLSLDWKPALNLIGDYGISTNQFALSIRFVF